MATEPATAPTDRILSLDIIRGIAVMAIFSVNVVGMAMIESAYFYPPDYGFDSVGDKVMFTLNSIFVDGRFRGLFSILFGASMTLVIERAVAAGKAGWKVHYPRMIVLMLFGVVHYYLLFWGDILINYALVGMIAFMFWRLKPSLLLLFAALGLSVFYTPQVVEAVGMVRMIEDSRAPGASAELKAEVEEMIGIPDDFDEQIAKDKAAHASVLAHLRAKTTGNAAWRPWGSVLGYGLETLGLMLIGMAGYKSGFLTGTWPRKTYRWIAATFLGADLLLHAVGAWFAWKANFAPEVYWPWTRAYNAPLHPVGALGYAALIILIIDQRSAIGTRIAAVGRAAFTNYLGASIIGVLIFNGTFGGLYGELSRGEAWLIVPPVWVLMLLWSKWWLGRFRYGPLEWAWRCLARWKWEPMRKPVEAAAT